MRVWEKRVAAQRRALSAKISRIISCGKLLYTCLGEEWILIKTSRTTFLSRRRNKAGKNERKDSRLAERLWVHKTVQLDQDVVCLASACICHFAHFVRLVTNAYHDVLAISGLVKETALTPFQIKLSVRGMTIVARKTFVLNRTLCLFLYSLFVCHIFLFHYSSIFCFVVY